MKNNQLFDLAHNTDTNNNLEWNVFISRNGEILPFNIFNNVIFREGLKELDLNNFNESLSRLVFYCFGSKCEYEVTITSVTPRVTKDSLAKMVSEHSKYNTYTQEAYLTVQEKVDVRLQLKLNWSRFVEYIKSKIKEI